MMIANFLLSIAQSVDGLPKLWQKFYQLCQLIRIDFSAFSVYFRGI